MDEPRAAPHLSNLGRRERQRRKIMAKLGIPDFETLQQYRERQQKMVRRFERAAELQHYAEWQECEPGFCAPTPCRDGCWFASRDHRYRMITQGHRLLSNQPGDLLFATITHPKWELPIGKLADANIPAVPRLAAAANAIYRSPALMNMFSYRGLR
jgi:hypothetical protein